jgi:hypothetical protein
MDTFQPMRGGPKKQKNGRLAEACRPYLVIVKWELNRCAADASPPAYSSVDLEGLDVRCLQALWTFGNFEFNRLAIIQRLVAIGHDGGEVNENVFSALSLDESKALAGIEPLHCSLFFTHFVYSFLRPQRGRVLLN